MQRRVFNLLAAVSLLLCMATAGVWVHSGFCRTVWGYHGLPDASGMASGWELGTGRGRVIFSTVRYGPSTEPHVPGHYGLIYRAASPDWAWLADRTPNGGGVAGFYWEHIQMPSLGRDAHRLAIPDWFLILLSLALPVCWWRRRAVSAPGFCAVCGYDLRATPHRCPECGAVAVDTTRSE